jgi:hypothetical protein
MEKVFGVFSKVSGWICLHGVRAGLAGQGRTVIRTGCVTA